MAGVPGAEVGPLPSAASAQIQAMRGRIKGCRSAGSIRSRATATSCTRGSRLRIDSSTVVLGGEARESGRDAAMPMVRPSLTPTIVVRNGLAGQGHIIVWPCAKNRRRNPSWPAGDTPGRALGRNQSPCVLARRFSRRSDINAPIRSIARAMVSEPLRRQRCSRSRRSDDTDASRARDSRRLLVDPDPRAQDLDLPPRSGPAAVREDHGRRLSAG